MKYFTLYRKGKWSRCVAAILFLSLSTVSAKAQSFWTEAFSNGCTSNCNAGTYTGPNGAWTVTSLSAEGTKANVWYISCAEDGLAAGSCGSACSASDPSLHVGSVAVPAICPGGDCGASYLASNTSKTDKRAASPLINCSGHTGITITFNYIGKGQTCTTDYCDLQYSSDGGTTWNNLQTCLTAPTCGSGQGQWTAFSASLPAACDNNANVKIGFHWVNNNDNAGNDPSFAVDDIDLSTVTTSNTITTGTMAGSPFCACGSVSVPFTSTGTFTAGNVYTAQLSDASGSFAAPVAIGTLTSTANTGTIVCSIPCSAAAGTAYRIRVVSSTPAITGTDNGVNIVINAQVTPAVTISASPSGAVCSGQAVTFTASPTNGGTTPTYQWAVNGVDVTGATGVTFTSSTLANGDVVSVTMTSNAACTTAPTSTATLTMTVNPSVTPSVSITASTTTICTGDAVTFTAAPTNGGTTPAYQWQVNGVDVSGATASTFTSTTLANGDNVSVTMTSNAACASPATATSNTITITVSSSVAASVSISASSTTICPGDAVTFTATPTGGGSTPTYQWQVNGTDVSGETAATFTSTTLNNGDNVTVVMTSSSSCATGSPATSNTITMTVASGLVASVSITASPSTACAGQPITFTATPTNGGATPGYQWQVNGVDVTGATTSTFVSSTLSNGDNVTVIMTSSSGCATGSPATSNAITVVITTVTPSVSIAASPSGAVCSGQPVTFTATPTNGGASPAYQWQLNGADIAGATGATYTSTSLANGDVITVVLTSSDPCASPATASSNAITMTVNSSLTPAVSITGPSTVCSGDPATFTATPTNGGTAPTYQWAVNGSNAGTNSATFTSSSLATGSTITCTMTSDLACASPASANSNTITVTVQTCTPPVANFSGTPQVMCQPGCVNFTDLSTNSPTSWQWVFPGATPSTSTAQNPTNICYSADGSYDVGLIVSNASGSDTLVQTGFITVGQPVQVHITGNLLITSCEKTELTAVPGDGTYQWGPTSGSTASITVSPSQTQQYWVTYTSPLGCMDSDTTTVVVKDLNTYFLPTGFTPNGDGINDEIHLHGRGIDYFTLKIFDRIGEKVFETSDMEKGWDGKLLGLPMNDGVFVYELNITFCNGETVKKHGDITLVK